jgi:hypothetical protein
MTQKPEPGSPLKTAVAASSSCGADGDIVLILGIRKSG